jgi:cytochrome c556
MRVWMLAAAMAAGLGTAGAALAQGNEIADRRAGLRQMGQAMEAIGAVVQSRGDQAQIGARVDQMIAFYQSFPGRFPAATLTPPMTQGTADGQTRALAAIDANRADFGTRNENMIAALNAMKTAAGSGGVTADMLRSTGGVCAACHQSYRAR